MSFESLLKTSSSRKDPSLYDIIGCDKASSAEQITAEYRSKVRLLHPDKVQDILVTEEFTKFQAAYSLLSDPARRKIYDAWLGCPLPMSFEEFERNSDSIKQSMHWVTPKSTPMIPGREEPAVVESRTSRWGQRYESEAVRKFRDYEI